MRRQAVSVLFAVLVLTVAATPAFAGKPDLLRIPIDDVGIRDDGLSELCGFDIFFDGQGHILVKTTFDASGSPVRQIANYGVRVEMYSAVSRLHWVDTGVDKTTFHPDGSITIRQSGNLQAMTAPGRGKVHGANGHIIIEIDPTGAEETTVKGHFDQLDPTLFCDLLG